MNIPLNGRVAIVDDNENEAMPLIKSLSKHRIPFVFYKGDESQFLPDGSINNDIRLLFLDINLLNHATPSDRMVKSTLFNVLKRIISDDNYPYLLIYWSKQESQYAHIVEDLFNNELKDRAPIEMKGFVKSEFFPNFESTAAETDKDIFPEIEDILNTLPSYKYLLLWENIVHKATDSTLQSVFRTHKSLPNWLNNANYILNKLGESYSGKIYNDLSSEDRIKSSFFALNMLQIDYLENNVSEHDASEVNLLDVSDGLSLYEQDYIFEINSSLLFSRVAKEENVSGIIYINDDKQFETLYNEFPNMIIDRSVIKKEVEAKKLPSESVKGEIAKQEKQYRNEIKTSWKKIIIEVSPLCDSVQKKIKYFRFIFGVFIESKYLKIIDQKSEANFISPIFRYESKEYTLILNFRYFNTVSPQCAGLNNLAPILRIRQQVLAEIQSKLARHVNRQGILFLTK